MALVVSQFEIVPVIVRGEDVGLTLSSLQLKYRIPSKITDKVRKSLTRFVFIGLKFSLKKS